MSDSRTRASAPSMAATRAASRSLSPTRISLVATVSFSLITGTVPRPQQGVEGGAGVQVAPPFLGVFQSQEDLRHGDVVAGEGLLVGMGEADLPGGRRRLLFLQAQGLAWVRPRWRRPTAMAPEDTSNTSCAAAALAPLRRRSGRRASRGGYGASGLVDQQGRADLDHQAAGLCQVCHAVRGRALRSWPEVPSSAGRPPRRGLLPLRGARYARSAGATADQSLRRPVARR